MALNVNVVCRNYNDDRVLPRFSRYLRDVCGWTLTPVPDLNADIIYLLGYFEAQQFRHWPDRPVVAYFTHREEEPPGNAKAQLFDDVARRSSLRVAMCRLYADYLQQFGATVTPPLPVELDRFTIAEKQHHSRPVIGLAGYTYMNHRKGEDLVRALLDHPVAHRVDWGASGRGWPVRFRRYEWSDMPQFYQGLDALLCPSRVEGGPMPVLEALACGVPVIVPAGVGIIDELPDILGIYRYERGNVDAMAEALERFLAADEPVDRRALRAAVERYSIEAFAEANRRAVEALAAPRATPNVEPAAPVTLSTDRASSTRGIYIVAFGGPSRQCAVQLIESIRRHMPDIPICLAAAEPLHLEDIFVKMEDTDIGGRRAKLRAYEATPQEWRAVLYLDADTEVVAPIYRYFEWIEDGWEFVICKDPHLSDTMEAFARRNNAGEMADTERRLGTLRYLQWNGGVWAFGRNERVAAFFRRWQDEWEIHAQRDQGALVRAMYTDPLRILTLGNEWNTFEKYSQGITTAGLMHYPGRARRWRGHVPGHIDSPVAWQMVEAFEHGHSKSGLR